MITSPASKIPITDSGPNRSPIPVAIDHPPSELSGAVQPAGRETLHAFAGGTNAGEHRRLSMRKIPEVLRLYFAAALSIRAIARSLGTSPSTVRDYLRRARVAGLGWPLPESVDDTGLESRLFPVPPPSRKGASRAGLERGPPGVAAQRA